MAATRRRRWSQNFDGFPSLPLSDNDEDVEIFLKAVFDSKFFMPPLLQQRCLLYWQFAQQQIRRPLSLPARAALPRGSLSGNNSLTLLANHTLPTPPVNWKAISLATSYQARRPPPYDQLVRVRGDWRGYNLRSRLAQRVPVQCARPRRKDTRDEEMDPLHHWTEEKLTNGESRAANQSRGCGGVN
ncbi:hypothetical protein B0H13DRAFT_1889691 [Mycena leptocephala]|nr:hypothetical protein B0H13DRAFT_1889691 [Mycena leptocephala]